VSSASLPGPGLQAGGVDGDTYDNVAADVWGGGGGCGRSDCTAEQAPISPRPVEEHHLLSGPLGLGWRIHGTSAAAPSCCLSAGVLTSSPLDSPVMVPGRELIISLVIDCAT